MARRYWVYCIGTANSPPPVNWLEEWNHHIHEMWFPVTRRPTGINAGDRAVIHGSDGKGFLAAVEVTSPEPEENSDEEGRIRWPHVLQHRLLVGILADHNAPSLDDVGWDNPRRLRRNSHVEIDAETYERIANAVVDGARRAVAP
jgi:hypothetical protein